MLTTKSAHRKDITTGLADMQHRHFATIATIIRDVDSAVYSLTHQGEAVKVAVAKLFADKLAHTNPKFDRDRFLRACLQEVA